MTHQWADTTSVSKYFNKAHCIAPNSVSNIHVKILQVPSVIDKKYTSGTQIQTLWMKTPMKYYNNKYKM